MQPEGVSPRLLQLCPKAQSLPDSPLLAGEKAGSSSIPLLPSIAIGQGQDPRPSSPSLRGGSPPAPGLLQLPLPQKHLLPPDREEAALPFRDSLFHCGHSCLGTVEMEGPQHHILLAADCGHRASLTPVFSST